MYLRREEMGAGTAGARRWLVPTASGEDGGRRMYLRREEMGAGTDGLGEQHHERRWVQEQTALVSNTMRREQRLLVPAWPDWFRSGGCGRRASMGPARGKTGVPGDVR